MFAVIKSGGRQYKVSVGQTLEVNRLPFEDGEQVRLEDVLLISDADRTLIGSPLVENAAVLATVVRQARGPKLIVFKYKSKKRYRHRRGHRQELTILSIDDILADGVSLVTGEKPRAQETPAEEQPVEPETSAVAEAEAPVVEEQPAEEPEKRPTRRRRRARSEESEGAGEDKTEE